MSRVFVALLVIFVVSLGTVSFASPDAAVAGAPTTVTIDTGSVDGVQAAFSWLTQAARDHNYVAVVALILVLIVAGLRVVLPKLHDKTGAFFNTEAGKGILVLITSEVCAFASAALAHKMDSVKSVIDGVIVAFVAAGGYSIVKPLIAKIFGGKPPVIGQVLSGGAGGGAAGVLLLLGLSAAGCTPAQDKAWKDVGTAIQQKCNLDSVGGAAAEILTSITSWLSESGQTPQSIAEGLVAKYGISKVICASEVFFANIDKLTHAAVNPKVGKVMEYIRDHKDTLGQKKTSFHYDTYPAVGSLAVSSF